LEGSSLGICRKFVANASWEISSTQDAIESSFYGVLGECGDCFEIGIDKETSRRAQGFHIHFFILKADAGERYMGLFILGGIGLKRLVQRSAIRR
jgi:hypothetical protein